MPGKKNFLPCHGSVHPASTVVSSHRPFITVTWTTTFASRKEMSNKPDFFVVAAQVGNKTNGSISYNHPRIPRAKKALHVSGAVLKFGLLSRSNLSRLIDLTPNSDWALATK
jgi:hypothetical protein